MSSSFGSSLINKSGRRVAPKAVARRKAALPISAATAASDVAPDVVASIEPVATGDDVLAAQYQVQDSITSSRAQSGARGNTTTNKSPVLERAPQGGESVSRSIEGELAGHRQKRQRLDGTSTSPAREGAHESAAARPVTHASAPATRSRTTGALQSPPDSQPETNIRAAQHAQGRESSTGQQADTTGITDSQQPSDANWVVTTQDQVRKRRDVSHRRSAPRHQSSSTPVANNADQSAAADVTPVSATRTARQANADRRKSKKEALRRAMGQSPQSSARDSSAQDNVPRDPILDDTDRVEDVNPDMSAETTSRRKTSRTPRKRADTPEELENVTIVDSLVTMAELSTRERKFGRKSDRERKMRLIDWDLVKTRRREEEVRMAMERGRFRNTAPSNPEDDEDEGDLENEENLDAALNRVAARNRARRRGTGIRIRVVNGEHVIDEQSQRVDRHALANEDLDALEEVEEEELTQRFNSQSYVKMKRRDPAERLANNDRWTDEATDKFFACLARFGTDFMILSKMFPGRTRRQIKAKFVKVERAEPARVHEALYGGLRVGAAAAEEQRPRWDLDVYRESAGIELSQLLDPRQVERDLEVVRKERELAIAEQRKETEEVKRQRRLAGEVSSEDEAEEQEGGAAVPEAQVVRARVADHELEEIEEYE